MRRTFLFGILATALAFSAGGALFTAQAQDKPVKLIANTIKSKDAFDTKAYLDFAKRVKEYTNGHVIIEVHFGGELGYKAADGLRVVENGSVDIGETIGAFEGATIPDIMITTLPFFITTFDEFAFFDRLFRRHLDKLYAKRNAKILFTNSMTKQHFWNKKEVDTIADVAGIKMRTYDKVTTDMLSAVGAAPLRIDYAELYTALQQGTVAGMVTSIASVIDLKAWEVVSHANLTGFSTGGVNSMAINMKTWNSLSPKNQAAMLRAAREVEDTLRVDVPALERSGLDTLKANGMKINPVPPETIAEMRRLTAPIRDAFLKSKASPELRAIVDEYEKIRGLK
jgi:TRAP-type C4-dicarboxylate transport system substrate-binding protein